MTERSLGIVIYPDGSQAEIIYHETGAPIWEEWTEIVHLKKPRRLTFAPFNLLVGMLCLCFGLQGCASLRLNIVTTGEKDYCLADFRAQTRSCEYDSHRECMDAIEDRGYCHRRSK